MGRARKQNHPTAVDTTLKRLYYAYGKASALQNNPRTLLNHLHQTGKHPQASLQQVIDFLSKQPSYTVHHRVPRRQWPHRRIHVPSMHVRCDADLFELQDLKQWNSGYQYGFVVIDAFSRKVWAQPVKTKEAKHSADALLSMLTTQHLHTQLLYTDGGKEFSGGAFQRVLTENDIQHRVCTSNDFHCPFVERVIRTLKEKLFQAMTSGYTRRWVDLLPKIVATYNQTRHSGVRMPPEQAHQPGNYLEAMRHTVPMAPLQQQQRPTKYKFSAGDLVRILKSREAFHKGYLPRFTWEIFRVKQRANQRPVDKHAPPAYTLEDLDGEEIEHAVFYEPELVRVHESQLTGPAPVREILQQRGDQVLVWFQGYPKASAKWMPRSRIV